MKLSSSYLLLFVLFTTACVSAKKHKELQSRYDAKEVELVEAKATIIDLRKQLEQAQEEKKALTQDLRKLTSSSKANRDKDEQISILENKIKSLEAKIAYLEKKQAANDKANPNNNKPKKPKNAY
jgi:chromosome segregation ATPase